jgi:hypothetical protein
MARFKTGCIGSERDPQKHACKKKDLTAAFSNKSLQQQEVIVQDVVDGRYISYLPMATACLNRPNQASAVRKARSRLIDPPS